ncbi:hypothetical protein V8C34DRAFT_295401 [Trichoderma compactum]
MMHRAMWLGYGWVSGCLCYLASRSHPLPNLLPYHSASLHHQGCSLACLVIFKSIWFCRASAAWTLVANTDVAHGVEQKAALSLMMNDLCKESPSSDHSLGGGLISTSRSLLLPRSSQCCTSLYCL